MHPETPPGRWYVLGPGETLEGVARQAGVPVEDILELNGLRAEEVGPGKLIYLLEGTAAVEPAMPPSVPAAAPAPVPAASVRVGLRWPLEARQVVVASPFGAREGRPHEGIDLAAAVGTPVYAAADGRVVYAGDGIRGYGNLIVLQHAGDLVTVYAHNAALLVHQGDPVRAGDRVALVGQSGRATGPHLHFEVRQGQIPRDPMSYLPTLPSREGAAP
jgi:murein DD-endopeptidase MepM/ murein hydrolase activator NlpD